MFYPQKTLPEGHVVFDIPLSWMRSKTTHQWNVFMELLHLYTQENVCIQLADPTQIK